MKTAAAKEERISLLRSRILKINCYKLERLENQNLTYLLNLQRPWVSISFNAFSHPALHRTPRRCHVSGHCCGCSWGILRNLSCNQLFRANGKLSSNFATKFAYWGRVLKGVLGLIPRLHALIQVLWQRLSEETARGCHEPTLLRNQRQT